MDPKRKKTPEQKKQEQVLMKICQADKIIVPFNIIEETNFTPTPTPTPEFIVEMSYLLVLEPKEQIATLYEQKNSGDESRSRMSQSIMDGQTQNSEDNRDQIEISNITYNILRAIYCYNGQGEFQEDELDTSLHTIETYVEEQFLVAMAYIADCTVKGNDVDVEIFSVETGIERERDRMVDLFKRVIELMRKER